jgi:phosphopantothenoylcysteine decarboxylase / phosphopantothenate---cysteine ligase
MARLLLGVSGGIAAYKALEFVRLATASGHAVRVIQTPASLRFVGRASFEALTGAPVLVSEFEPDPDRGAFPGQPAPEQHPLSHLELVSNADAYLIAPASANTLARLAHGLADNLLCSAALAADCPLAVAPAMNDRMWRHPATRENVRILRERGVTLVEPGVGRLASAGEWGAGRLAEPPELLAACEALIAARPAPVDRAANGAGGDGPNVARPGDWAGCPVLVTAGGTREPIDSVRYVGNRSSGRMGFALADAAAARGARVTVVAANVDLPRNPAVRYVDVGTALELRDACLEHFPDSDVLLMAAAVADFRPADAVPEKIKKHGRDSLELALQATPDVVSELAAARRPGQTLVGFAAEHGADAIAHARAKLSAKGLDAVVVNDISRSDIGFESAENEVTIVTAAGEEGIARTDKAQVAERILDAVARLRKGAAAASA